MFDGDREPAPEGFSAFHTVLGNYALLETVVNDSRLVNFLVDTGSTNTFLSIKVAREIGELRESAITVQGISGVDRDIYEVPDVVTSFAGLTQRHEWVPALDLSRISTGLGTEISGILGISTLSHLRITFDYRNGYVRLESDRR